jgi:peptidoglycan/xylan/chitin deacetylase (PgdA/CDA1 family)
MFVALTFDVEDPDQRDHGHPGDVASILGALDASGIRATFFVQGRWAEANPVVAAAIGAAGHLVGSHSYFHADTRLLRARGVRQDVVRAHDVIVDVVGVDPRPWYRLPYGAGADDRTIERTLRSLGYRHAGWDVDVRDYAMDDPAAMVPAMERALAEHERTGATHAIVLLHSWPVVTAEAMPELCRFVAERCEGTVTVDEVPGGGAVPTRSRLAQRADGLASRARRLGRPGS